jgi:UDP-glucuronate 4-epimerase
MSIILTGAAGFIGCFTAERLLRRGETVVGVDDFNPYYDVALKTARAARLAAYSKFTMVKMDVAEADAFKALLLESGADRVVHLAAQAGVRYSLENPLAYERSNVRGHLSVLEACRHAPRLTHLVYASSSSVYGERAIDGPFCETDPVDKPASLYAATKRACELMSGTYASVFGLRQSGLRFFTVYGPMGRPDMAYFTFTRKMIAGEPIEVFGEGRMARDFTFIDDVVDAVVGVLDRPPPDAQSRILNVGDSRPVALGVMIEVLEQALGKSAVKIMRPMQAGDVRATYADVSRLHALTGYQAKVPLEEGLVRFVEWHKSFYGPS